MKKITDIRFCIDCDKKVFPGERYTLGRCLSCYGFFYKSDEHESRAKAILPSILTIEQKEIINGSLLGDGSVLYATPTRKDCHYAVGREQGDLSYLKWNFEKFRDFTQTSKVVLFEKFDKRWNKTYYGCQFATCSSPVFTQLRQLWYPEGIKILPAQIMLSDLMMSVWLADDGGFNFHHPNQKSLMCRFATQGFQVEEVEFLVEKLEDLTGEEFSISVSNKSGKAGICGYHNASCKLLELSRNHLYDMRMNRKIDNFIHFIT